jgi:predicted dehydrogenase
MSAQRLNVGLIGLEPGRSWAARAHLPALNALADQFEVFGVANSSLASAEAAAAATGLPRAFGDYRELVTSPDIDVVTVTVRVPKHLEMVKAAIAAGKHVFCEWPLGNGLAEAEELAALAAAKGVLGVVGTQGRFAPGIQYVKQLIADGFVGEVLSTNIASRAPGWGGSFTNKRASAYLLDKASGANMLTIIVGHALASLREVFGELDQLSAVLATRRNPAIDLDTGEEVPVTAPDQVLMNGVFASGAPISLHYRGGPARDGKNLYWEINGTKGDLRISTASSLPTTPLIIEGAQGDDGAFKMMEVPTSYLTGFPDDLVPGNVARIYARMAADLRDGTHTAPSFNDAVVLHRIIAGIEASARSGCSVRLTGN